MRMVEVYGTLRSFIADGTCRLNLAEEALPQDVRNEIVAFARLHESAAPGASGASGLGQVLERSVVAAGDRILREDEAIGSENILAVLPPVCGG